ncbi:MAG: metallopeptidase TldD-related protein, partial [Thermostichales cyanobacterium DRC_bins_46]
MTPLPLTETDLLSLCEDGVKAALAAGADQAEVYASAAQEMEVSFEKNDLNLVRVVGETTFGVRVFVQGRLGFATSNRPEDLQTIAAEAVSFAKLSPADPMQGLPDPLPLPPSSPQVDPQILALEPETLTQFGAEMLEWVRSRDPRITIDSGGISVGEGIDAIVTSQGIAASYHETQAGGSLFGMAIDGDEVGSFAYDGDEVLRWAELQPALHHAFARFAHKCLGALGARPGESFRGPILIPADSVDDFLGDLVAVLGAEMVRKGKSPLGGRLGEVIASPLLTLVEGGAGLPGHPIAPFDRE